MPINPKKYPTLAAAAANDPDLPPPPTPAGTPTYGEALTNMGIHIGYMVVHGYSEKYALDLFTTMYTILLSLVDRENLKDVKMDRAFDSLLDILETHLAKVKQKHDPGNP